MTCNFVQSEVPYFHFTDENFSCKIVPSFGGSIQEFIVDGKSIIKGVPISTEGFEEYKTFCNSAILFPFPNRIASGTFSFGDKPYQLDLNEPKYGNAIHGFVFTEHPEVTSQTDASLSLRFKHTESPGYPFPYTLDLEYTVNPNRLELEFIVVNTGTELMPFGLGWHPYFVTSDQQNFKLHFEADKKYLVNKHMIPDHSIPVNDTIFDLPKLDVDNAYRLTNSEVVLQGPDRKLCFNLPESSYLQLYNPESRKSFAIEPMSCAPDVFNNKIGLYSLMPGHSFQWKLELRFEIFA